MEGSRNAGHAALQHGLGQLFDEKRHSIGLDCDLVQKLLGQRLPAAQAPHDRGNLLAAQTGQGQPRNNRMTDKVVIEAWTRSYQQKNLCRYCAV